METTLFANASDERFFGGSDSETIQNAVNFAKQNKLDRVVIPHYNARTKSDRWIIDKAVLLPSNITVLLMDAHLRLADDVFDNIFRNENIGNPIQNTMEGEQSKIKIIGSGNAILDGGKHNGLTEQYCRDNPDNEHSMAENLLIYFANVREFEISNIHVYDSRWWSIAFYFCRMGRIRDIEFSNHATVENQDGIDLRSGCNNIIIENITGITGDDTIALTNLPLAGIEKRSKVEGKSVDIHDIIIKNVISSSHGCGIIRFLNEDGAKIYSVTVDTVMDTGRSIGGAGFIIGASSTRFVRERAHTMGEFKDITLKNLRLNAQTGLSISEPIENMLIENVSFFGHCKGGLFFSENFVPKHVKIKNVYYEPLEEEADCFIKNRVKDKNQLDGMKIEDVVVKRAKYLYRGNEVKIDGLEYENVQNIQSDDVASFESAYGRYFKYYYGKEPDNRPKDNRFTGVTEEDNI